MTPKTRLCDVCGDPAVVEVKDVIEIDNYLTGIVEYEAVKGTRAGCEAHRVESRTVARRRKPATWSGGEA